MLWRITPWSVIVKILLGHYTSDQASQLRKQLQRLDREINSWYSAREAAEVLENREAADRVSNKIRQLTTEAQRLEVKLEILRKGLSL